jgi:hypothetical protein
MFGSLFGGGGGDRQSIVMAPPAPKPAQAAPRISDAVSTSLAREESARQRRKKGVDDTILAGGLGDVGSTGSAAPVRRTSLLGGG